MGYRLANVVPLQRKSSLFSTKTKFENSNPVPQPAVQEIALDENGQPLIVSSTPIDAPAPSSVSPSPAPSTRPSSPATRVGAPPLSSAASMSSTPPSNRRSIELKPVQDDGHIVDYSAAFAEMQKEEASSPANVSPPSARSSIDAPLEVAPVVAEISPESLIDSQGQTLYKAATESWARGRLEEAANLLRGAAEQGHLKALTMLGACYLGGVGLQRDIEQAIRCFEKVAESSDGSGETQLGLMYLKGRGVDKDVHKALLYFTQAFAKGDRNAQAHLAYIQLEGKAGVEMNKEAALKKFREIEPYSIESAFYLGQMYLLGDGVPKDFTKAISYLRTAAKSNHLEAHVLLGQMYINGWGVSASLWEAAKLFMRGAERGHPLAQFYIACMYRDGKGLAKNEAQAKKWFTASAEQGNTLALYALARYCLEREDDSDWLDITTQFKRAAAQSNNDELPEKFYVDAIVRALAGFE